MITRSLFLDGIIDGIVGAFSAIGDWIVGGLESIYNGIVNMIQAWVLKIIYVFLKGFFLIIDFIVLLFRKMCGLDSVKIDGTYVGSLPRGEFEGDLALVLIQSQQVMDVFISILIVAVILLFVFTFVAIIRNQYSASENKTKGSNGPIIGKALKALFTFLFVPAICIIGIMVSNGLLRTLDSATRLSSSTSISGSIFQAAANSANRINTSEQFWEVFQADSGANGLNANNFFNYSSPPASIDARDYAAILVNEAFAMNAVANININAAYRGGELPHMQNIDAVEQIASFDFMNENIVWVYYDLTKFNWLLAFVACFFIGSALLVASIGVIQRLYEITLLFAISPPFVALMPLDDGAAFKGWRKKFVEDVLVMYGPILAVNFFFIITPILQHIDLFYSDSDIATYGATLCVLFNDIGHLLFIMCGALMIKDFSTILTGLITGNDKNDLMTRGEKMNAGVAGAVGNVMNAPYKMKRAVGGWKSVLPSGKGKNGGDKGKDGNGGDGSGGALSKKGGLRGKLGAVADGAKTVGAGLRTKASSLGGWASGTSAGQWTGRNVSPKLKKAGGAVSGGIKKAGGGLAKAGGAVRHTGQGTTDAVRGGFRAVHDATSKFKTNHLTTSWGVARKVDKLNAKDKKRFDAATTKEEKKQILAESEQMKRNKSRAKADNVRSDRRWEKEGSWTSKANLALGNAKIKLKKTFMDEQAAKNAATKSQRRNANSTNYRKSASGKKSGLGPKGTGSPTP